MIAMIFAWIKKTRKLGSILFLDVYDISGFDQVLVDEKYQFYNEIYSTPKETLVSIKGTLKNRKSINNEVPVGGQAVLGRQCHKSTPWHTESQWIKKFHEDMLE